MTSASACSFINSIIHAFLWTASFMPRNLFRIYFLRNDEVFQGSTALFSMLHSLKRLTASERNFRRTKSQQLC